MSGYKRFFSHFKLFVLGLSVVSITAITSCGGDDSGGGVTIENEVALSGDATQTVVEGTTSEVTVSYNFAIAARAAGSVTIAAVTDGLTYGTNYTTSPAEENGVISVAFAEGDASVSFTIAIIDDNLNLPDGSVTFTLSGVEGETADVSATSASFTLTIQDNEGTTISLDSDEIVSVGEVVPGTNSAPVEVSFTTLNVASDITATASAEFEVSDAADGTFGETATLAPTATSVFVRASPDGAATLGILSGTVTLASGDASTEISIETVVSTTVGSLFWAEYFDYPINETYPAYSNDYPNYGGESASSWGIVPISAVFRAAATYNGADATLSGTGLQRSGFLDTWYGANRLRSVTMGDGPLSFTGYPGSGTGRTALLALNYGNQSERNDCANEGAFLSKNTFIARRFVEDGSEVTSGNVYFSTMIKVNYVADESTSVLKNAIMMLTGDASFVNANAMKLNIQNDGSGGFNFGVSKSSDDGSVVYGTNSYTVGETYAVVFKVEINEDNEGDDPNDVVSVWVFEEGDAIPSFEDSEIAPEAMTDAAYNQNIDVFDVTSGLETFYTREVADVFNAGGVDNVDVHGVEFSGIRVATSWNALFFGSPLYDNITDDPLQTIMHGNPNCADVNQGPPNNLGNVDQ